MKAREICALALLGLAHAALMGAAARADDAQPVPLVVETKGVWVKARGKAKRSGAVNPAGVKPPPPPRSRGGRVTRGDGPGACLIHIENYTGYLVDIWVDGRERGTMAQYGGFDLTDVVTGSGKTTMLGIARFSDGQQLEFRFEGPPDADVCPEGGGLTWKVKPSASAGG